MDTMTKIKGAKINDIIKVVLQNILLELHFNIEYLNEKLSFKLSISDDGETISFKLSEKWIALNDFNYEIYSAVKVNSDDELLNLLFNEIVNIKFGVGNTLDTQREVLYYVKVITDKNSFLFFNNGDEGAYSFDKIEAILENDIYGFEWLSRPPLEN